ncbi:MAG TPA: hypothetical protein VJL87_01990, partial [Bdellovibrionota bacterium]|nr:hypothetical protein [Bdellovibrionota bacterium]
MMKRILILGFALLCLVGCGDDDKPGPPPGGGETYNFTIGGKIISPFLIAGPPPFSIPTGILFREIGNWQVDEQKRVMKVEIDSRVLGIRITYNRPGTVTPEHQFRLKYQS